MPAPSRTGLISVSTLAGRLGEVGPDLAIVDLRQDGTDGLPGIPGAVWVDLHDGFAQRRPERNLTYDLPTAAEVAASLGRLGIGPETEVVYADDMLNRWATRAYWVLHYYRHPGPAWVLDGGLPMWRASGQKTEAGFATRAAADHPEPSTTDESILVRAAELKAGIADGNLQACDVRTSQEYTGEVAFAARGGHVPGAAFVPFELCVAADNTFRPNPELEAVLAPFLETDATPVTYCQGGIRASLAWFCLHELLGRPARLYAASWEEWGADAGLPVEKH